MNNQPLTLSSSIENKYKGLQLIDYLCSRFPYKTKDAWIDAISEKHVAVNATLASPDLILKLKDLVSYTSIRNEPDVATDIETIFEDEYLLVVNKPAPLPVHSDGYFIANTLIHILRNRTGNPNLGLGHRLDRETTGILVLAKDRMTTGKLMNRFEGPDIEKKYLAVTSGRVDFTQKEIHGWIGPKPGSLIPMRQHFLENKTDGYKESLTRFSLVEQFDQHSLICCDLLSGRTNQIRVHLEALGFPIVGDKLYGQADDTYLRYVKEWKKTGSLEGNGDREHRRQLLHAWKLVVNHPITDEKMRWEASMPKDMEAFIQKLEK